MNLVHSWWDWCSQSLSHTFAGVTAPLLLLAGVSVVLFYSSQGGDGTTPLPPRSDIAGVCATAPSSAPTGSSVDAECASTVNPSGVAVTTPTPLPPTPTPQPRTYTVQAGDSLSRVCANEVPDQSLDSCLDSIVKLNSLSGPDEITEGQSLRLPPKSTASGSTNGTAQRPAATPTPVASATTGVATQPDPTPEASLVAIGPAETADEEPTAEPVAEVPDEEEPLPEVGQEYVIEDGDTLLGICVSLVPDMDEDECVEFVVLLNGLSGSDEIQSGQTIYLP